MQERSFIYAMLHTRMKGEHLSHFRDEVKGLTLEDKQWFVEQFAKEFNIEIVRPTISTALSVIAQPQPHNTSFVKEYFDYEPESGSDADGA